MQQHALRCCDTNRIDDIGCIALHALALAVFANILPFPEQSVDVRCSFDNLPFLRLFASACSQRPLLDNGAPIFTWVAKLRPHALGSRSRSHRICASALRGSILVKASSGRAGSSSLCRRKRSLPRRSGPPTILCNMRLKTLGM